MGRQGGFVRYGGVQGRSEGFVGGHWSSGEVREVRVGHERSGECRRGQGNPGKSRDVRGVYGIYGSSGEYRGVQGSQMEVNGHQEGLGRSRMSLEKKEIKGYSNQVENKVLKMLTMCDFFGNIQRPHHE